MPFGVFLFLLSWLPYHPIRPCRMTWEQASLIMTRSEVSSASLHCARKSLRLQAVPVVLKFRGRAGVTKSLRGIRHGMRRPPFVGFLFAIMNL